MEWNASKKRAHEHLVAVREAGEVIVSSAQRSEGLRREPVLPPGFTLVTLPQDQGDAFAHAQEIAAEAGAATLVWVRRFDMVEFAVVLEPDAPLRRRGLLTISR